MNRRPLHIRCLDEGHGPVDVVPFEGDGTTALMVNPRATNSVLLDAAKARVERIADVTRLFIELENESFDFPREDACRLLTTVSAMAHEVSCLLAAAQAPKAQPEPTDADSQLGYEAAQAWYADMINRMDTLCQQEALRQRRQIKSGYCVASNLNETLNALPAKQCPGFLDAVGAYVMHACAFQSPANAFLMTHDELAMYASTAAAQDAWGDSQNNDDDAQEKEIGHE